MNHVIILMMLSSKSRVAFGMVSFEQEDVEQLERWLVELKKGFSKPFILVALLKGDLYAYKITKEVLKISEGQVSIAGSNVYPMLNDLVKQGFIDMYIKTNRKYYHLTEKGRQFLVMLQPELKRLSELLQKLSDHPLEGKTDEKR